ncbi:MAG: DUF1279 domain-containing protein [Proteobacteria bacterium]|nr:DUF1279 domain-containing protein [Pseudomonadota bacterium]
MRLLRRIKTRSKEVLRRYGWVYFWTLMVLWSGEGLLWALALKTGVDIEALFAWVGLTYSPKAEAAGLLATALALTQVTKIPRLAVTAAITPAVARWLGRDKVSDDELLHVVDELVELETVSK